MFYLYAASVAPLACDITRKHVLSLSDLEFNFFFCYDRLIIVLYSITDIEFNAGNK